MRIGHFGRWRTILLSAAVLAGVAPAVGRGEAPAAPRLAPSFELPTRHGTVSLQALRGNLVYVDFWASWCDPCRRSFPWLATLHQRYGARGLTVVAINLDKNREAADKFLAKYPAPFTVAFDPAGKTAEAFRVEAMPSSFLLGADGTVLLAHAGFEPKDTGAIEARIEEALPK